jgi:hypothetical protein
MPLCCVLRRGVAEREITWTGPSARLCLATVRLYYVCTQRSIKPELDMTPVFIPERYRRSRI